MKVPAIIHREKTLTCSSIGISFVIRVPCLEYNIY